MGGIRFARWFFRLITPFRHHIRIYRPQLLLVFALGVSVAVLLYPHRESVTPYSIEYVHSGLVFGEVLLPALVGWLAASLVLRDSFLEVSLTTPYRQTRLVLERLFVFLATATVAWLIFLIFIWWLADRPKTSLVELVLASLSTTLLFGAIGLWSSLRLRTWIGAGVIVTLVWGSGLVFRQVWLSHPLSYPFLTYFLGDSLGHPFWWINRFLLCGISAILIFDSCRLVNNEEVLLTAFLSEDS